MDSRSSPPKDRLWKDDEALHRYQALVDSLDDGIYQLDAEGHVLAVNDVLLEMTGYSRGELLGEHVSLLLAEENIEHIDREIRDRGDANGDVATFECFVQTADGETVPCEVRVNPLLKDDELQGTIGVVRKRATSGQVSGEATSSEVLKTALKEMNEAVFVLDDEFDVVWANDTIRQYFGLDPREVTGRDKRQVVIELVKERLANPDEFAQRVLATYDDNTYVEEFDCQVTAADDREARWLRHWSKPIESGQYAGGRVERYTEITDQKQSADMLQKTEDRFQSLIDAVEEYAIFRLDADGHVASWNEGAREIKGYEAEEILGEHFSTFYTESERAAGVPERNLAAATAHGSTEDEGWRVRKDGSRFWGNVTITAVRDDDGTLQGYLKVTRDMTDRHKREQELESELQRIFSRISDAFYALDEEWSFTHVNERAEELLGHSREELLGKRFWEVFSDAEDTAVWDRFHEAMETQESVNFEVEDETLDSWMEITAYPSETGLSVYFRDITDRHEKQRQIRERERRLQEYKEYTDDILDAIDDLFYVVTPDGMFQRWNETLCTVSGYSDAEIETMHALDFIAEEDKKTIAEGIETVFETGSERVEATLRTKDGQHIPMEFAASIVETPDGTEVLAGITRDITDRIERERELEESNERLEQFAYAASHDLQEPLRMVSSYLRLIERRYGEVFDEDGQEFLDFAVDGADRMRDMIDGLLEYSRVESQGQPFEPVELDAVLADVRDNLRVMIEESDAEITAETLPRVRGDRRQLGQLFQNLLKNAIEYSGDEPPRIHITAERHAPRSTARRPGSETVHQWIVSVHDEGIGIDPEATDRIFEVFQSFDGPDAHSSGIGLALCERIVERHGGDIWVDTTPGEGTTFSFTLLAAGDDDE